MNDALHGSRASTPATGSLHPAIEFIGVDKRFPARGKNPEVIAARNVTLSIQPGEVVSLIGPSGCGKSTLLNMGSGLAKASAGTVKVNGEVVTGPNKHVAFMLQKDLLMPWRTISQNVEFGLELRGVRAADRAAISERLLAQCHLKGFGNSYPHQLSGGMAQRAALARALINHPKVLLLDEPLGALDQFTRMRMQDEVVRIWRARRTTTILVTHDIDEALYMCDRIVVMTPRPGRIERVMDVPLDRPRHRNDPRFLGLRSEILEMMNFAGDDRPEAEEVAS